MSRDLTLKNNDLFINPETGDFLTGNSDAQHVQDIINSWAGWWKEFPTLGVGVKRYLGKSGNIQVLKRLIKIHLKSDGYRADKVIVKGSQVFVTGERVRN
jgi:hypothetical protein|tara:strand:- start:2047 stop:2346 length:300 start_codon:yes stop_codon:yes gene_type:complete